MTGRLTLLFALWGLVGQSDTHQQTPVFRTEVHLVEVDVHVADRNGNFVDNLIPTDFEVYEDDVLREVATFELVDLPVPVQAHTEPGLPAVSDVATNKDTAEGRVFVLVLDDLHTSPERTDRVRRAALQFIENWMGADDLAAVTQTSGSRESSYYFTGNRQKLLDTVGGFVGRKERSAVLEQIGLREELILRETKANVVASRLRAIDQEQALRAKTALVHLQSLGRLLGGLEGRRKAILYIGEGSSYNMENFVQGESADSVAFDIRRATASAGLSNVPIYALDVRGFSAGQEDMISLSRLSAGNLSTHRAEDEDDPGPLDPRVQELLETVGLESRLFADEARRQHDFLRVLASETGGLAAVNQNDIAQGLNRLAADNRRFYQLGYTPHDVTADGRFRKIEIRVRSKGLNVRARKGYIIPKEEELQAGSAQVGDLSSEEPSDLLPKADLPLSESYDELLTSYRSGHFDEARNRLAAWVDDRVKNAVDQFRSRGADPRTLKAAILLHTDLATYDGWGLPTKSRASHLQAAEIMLGLIPKEKAFTRDWMLTVACYHHRSDLSVSLNQLKEANRRFPDDAEILLAMGVTYETSASVDHDRRMLKDAESFFRRAIDMDSALPEAHLRLGKVLLDRGGDRLEDATRELEWVVEKASDSYLLHLAHLFLGELHKERGNLIAAIAQYRAAVECEPRWQAAHVLLSYALHANGERSSSRDVIQRALRLPVTDTSYVDGYRLYSLGQLIKVPQMLEELRQGVVE